MNEIHKDYYELIRDNESLFIYVQEHAIAGLIFGTADLAQGISLSNSAWHALGYKKKPQESIDVTFVLELKSILSLNSSITKAIRDKKDFFESDITLIHHDGTWLYSSVKGAVIYERKGKLHKLVLCLGELNSTKNGTDIALLVENMIDLMYALDGDGIITYTSPSFVKECGYAPNELLGKSFMEYSHPDDTEKCWQALREFRRTGVYDAVEHRIKHKSGEWHWYISSGALNPSNSEVILSSHEVSALKKSEQKAKSDAIFYKTIQENQSIYIIKILVDTGKIVYVNDYFCQDYHFDKITLIGKSFFDIVHKNDLKGCIDEIEKCRRQPGATTRFTLRSPIRKGKFKYVEWEFTGIAQEDGVVTELLCIGLNITDKIHAEKSLLEEKQLLRTIIDMVPANIYVKDRFGRKIMANKSEWELMGAKSEAEVLGKTDKELYPAQVLQDVTEHDRKVLETNKHVVDECFLKDKNNSDRWLYISKVPFKNSDGETVGIVGVSVDMTERKLMEEELSKKEEKFRFISENISDAIMVLDGKKTLYVSPTFEKLFGYSSESVVARADDEFYDYVHPEDVTRVKEIIDEGMASRKPTMLLEYRYRHNDGYYLWREDSTSITYDEASGIERAIIVARDISDRKRVEEELQFTQYAIENTSDAVYWIRPDGSFYFVNKAACELVGYSREELLKLTVSDIDPSIDSKSWQKEFQDLKRKKFIYFQSQVISKNGTSKEIEVNANYIWYKGLEYNCAFIRNITDRKESELQLLRTKQMLEQVGKMAKIGGWEYDIGNDKLTWSDMTKKIHGVPMDYRPTAESAISFLSQESTREKLWKIVGDAVAEAKYIDLEMEYQITTATGEQIWVQFICKSEITDGKCVRLYGSFQEITEKKIVQLALIDRSELLAVVAEGSQEMLQTSDFLITMRNISARLGKTLRVDRVYIFQADYRGKQDFDTVSQKLEWTDENAIPQIDNPQLQNLPRNFGEEFLAPLFKAKPYKALVKDIDDVALRDLLASQDIMSILILPLLEGNKLWGFLGFDDCKEERVWKGEEYTILQSFAATVSHAITRKSIEDKITRSSELLQKLTDNIPGAVYQLEVSPSGHANFPFISEGIFKFENFPMAHEIMENSQLLFDLMIPEDRNTFFNEIRESSLNMTVKYLEFRTQIGGETKWYSSYSRPEMRTDGGLVLYGYFQDINERKLKNEALQRLVDISADQNKRLLNFAYIISHNIRAHTSNLSSILSIWEFAENENERKQYMEMLKTSMEKLDETITNLNEIITIQRDINTPKKLLLLHNEVSRAIIAVNNEITKYNAEIRNEVPNDVHIKVIPAYLDSILLNLLTNALKYRSKDRLPEIRIFLRQKDNYTILHVQDNGQGIDLEKYSNKLFGLYKTFHGNEDARGLGLFLIKNQIESMKGKIEVESKVNQGTTFKVYFNDHG